ncbi:hypothetical protein QZH41_008695, partial [Actinostola sp. cb2023]
MIRLLWTTQGKTGHFLAKLFNPVKSLWTGQWFVLRSFVVFRPASPSVEQEQERPESPASNVESDAASVQRSLLEPNIIENPVSDDSSQVLFLPKWDFTSLVTEVLHHFAEETDTLITVGPLLTATSPQRPPLHNGHLPTTATSTQRSPPHNGHLYTTVTSTQRSPLHNGHLYTTVTSTQRPPLHNGHLYTTVTSTQRLPLHNGHLYITATSTQRPPLHNGRHLYTTVTSTQRSPLHNGHLYTMATSTQRPPLHNGHLYTTATIMLLLQYPPWACCDLLGRREMYSVANEIIKLSSLPVVNTQNQASTTVYASCGRCNKPLTRSGWFCKRCQSLVEPCSLCVLGEVFAKEKPSTVNGVRVNELFS